MLHMNNSTEEPRRQPPPPCALTIAGSDSCGGAGIQADLKTFAAHGVEGSTAIIALTAQNTCGVTAVRAMDAEFVEAQIRAVAEDARIGATKTGMLANAEIIQAVVRSLDVYDLGQLVVDPVMVATSGARLLDKDAEQLMREHLLPRADLVTPNLPEAAVLAGLDRDAGSEAIADAILESGCAAVLVKGGHDGSDTLTDLLATPGSRRAFRHDRIGRSPVHGTGCALSAAITARLARGAELEEAVGAAIDWLQSALTRAWKPRKGPLRMLGFPLAR